jgi:hypothetical protein
MGVQRLTKLNHKHMAYILFRVGGYSNDDTAKILDMSPQTCKNWGKDQLIQDTRAEVESTITEGARNYLESLLPEVIFTIANLMREGDTQRIKLDAATRLLDKALPLESTVKVQGDPNAPILYSLVENEAERKALDDVAALTPEQKAEFAAALEQLEKIANAQPEVESD